MLDAALFPGLDNKLHWLPSGYVLQATNSETCLLYSFEDQSWALIPRGQIHKHTEQKLKTTGFTTVYGIMQMEVNKYLVMVSKALMVGEIIGRSVYTASEIQYICLSTLEAAIDIKYIAGLSMALKPSTLYFAPNYDLTQTLQQSLERPPKPTRVQFMFNQPWTRQLARLQAHEWITPFISGYVSISFVQLSHDCTASLAIISRRDTRRQGIRYLCRGVGGDGSAANTVETELVLGVEMGGRTEYFGYVQLRGSIPVYWIQNADLGFKPVIQQMLTIQENKQALQKVYQNILSDYGECSIVSLIDKSGEQGKLGRYFQQVHLSLSMQGMEMFWFDFHGQCRKMRYENLAKLIDLIDPKFRHYGYFHVISKQQQQNIYTQTKRQIGIFRTNCIDSLDRTNVVQSLIARRVLSQWLQRLGLRGDAGRLPAQMQETFRKMWTQNGNALSNIHTGTDAMKGDFTATGKRTLLGALKDAKTGTQRYFLGNFYDSRRQDYLDLALSEISPHEDPRHRIRHPPVTPLPILAVALISSAVLAYYTVGHAYDPPQEPGVLARVCASAAALVCVGQILRWCHGCIVRKPIRAG